VNKMKDPEKGARPGKKRNTVKGKGERAWKGEENGTGSVGGGGGGLMGEQY